MLKKEENKVINTMRPSKEQILDSNVSGNWPEFEGPLDDENTCNAFKYDHNHKFLRL